MKDTFDHSLGADPAGTSFQPTLPMLPPPLTHAAKHVAAEYALETSHAPALTDSATEVAVTAVLPKSAKPGLEAESLLETGLPPFTPPEEGAPPYFAPYVHEASVLAEANTANSATMAFDRDDLLGPLRPQLPREARYIIKGPQSFTARLCRLEEPNASTVSAEVLDLSLHGIKLQVALCVPFGQQVRIDLVPRGAVTPVELVAQVRWLRETPQHQWQLGCSLQSGLEEVQILDWAKRGLLERRNSHRILVDQKIQVVWESQQTWQEATLINIAQEGVCFWSTTQATPGTRLRLAFTQAPGEIWQTPAEVRWCLPSEQGYTCGCKLLAADAGARLQALTQVTGSNHLVGLPKDRKLRQTSLFKWSARVAMSLVGLGGVTFAMRGPLWPTPLTPAPVAPQPSANQFAETPASTKLPPPGNQEQAPVVASEARSLPDIAPEWQANPPADSPLETPRGNSKPAIVDVPMSVPRTPADQAAEPTQALPVAAQPETSDVVSPAAQADWTDTFGNEWTAPAETDSTRPALPAGIPTAAILKTPAIDESHEPAQALAVTESKPKRDPTSDAAAAGTAKTKRPARRGKTAVPSNSAPTATLLNPHASQESHPRETPLQQGYRALQAKQYSKAQKLLLKATQLNPKDPAPWCALAMCHYSQGKHAVAERYLLQAQKRIDNKHPLQLEELPEHPEVARLWLQDKIQSDPSQWGGRP